MRPATGAVLAFREGRKGQIPREEPRHMTERTTARPIAWSRLGRVAALACLAVTLAAAVRPHLQGLLLTGEAMGFFVLAMVLMPESTGKTVRSDPEDPDVPSDQTVVPQC